MPLYGRFWRHTIGNFNLENNHWCGTKFISTHSRRGLYETVNFIEILPCGICHGVRNCICGRMFAVLYAKSNHLCRDIILSNDSATNVSPLRWQLTPFLGRDRYCDYACGLRVWLIRVTKWTHVLRENTSYRLRVKVSCKDVQVRNEVIVVISARLLFKSGKIVKIW